METLLIAVLLGLIEGLTEFLPVSSTGHLILFVDLLAFQGPPGKVFEVAIQFGAILAICWLYRKKLWEVAVSLPTTPSSQRFATNLILGFFPAAVLGVLFHGFIKQVLFSPWVVSVMLVTGGVFILWVEKRLKPQARHASLDQITPFLALKVGLCQALAMVPGVSRSGATILGGVLLGVERKVATEFSFFLAIPTMLGATVYDLHKNWNALSVDDAGLIFTGFVSAFVAALLVVRLALRLIGRYGFTPFAWYRIAVGGIMFVLLAAGT